MGVAVGLHIAKTAREPKSMNSTRSSPGGLITMSSAPGRLPSSAYFWQVFYFASTEYLTLLKALTATLETAGLFR